MFAIKGLKFKIIAGAIAAVCLLAGIYLSFFHSRGFVKTSAVIVDVEASYGDSESGTTYYPTVEYTVDGKTYTGRVDQGSSSYRVGKTITVLYDPNDPGVVHPSRGFSIYLMIAGAIILAFIIFSSVKDKQSLQKLKDLREANGQTGYAPSVQGGERELCFLTDTGTARVGHRIEDKNRTVLYEAKMTKFSPVTAYEFDFIDHEHGITTKHLVGHEEETERSGLLLDSYYTFELDGEDIWEHLKNNGVDVETRRTEGSVWPSWRVTRNGEEIAILESSSQYVHEEDAEAHSVLNKLAVTGFYRIRTRQENLDLVFVTAMAFARSRALNDEGGTFGKQIRNSLKKGFNGE